MNQIPPLMNVFRQAEEESEWKRMLLRNSLHQFLLSNVDFLNSFSLCNVINGQNVLPPNLTNDLINQNFSLTNNSSFQDETLFSLIQNINDSLLQLFNYYQDILQQNPATALNPNPLSFLPFNVQPRISFNANPLQNMFNTNRQNHNANRTISKEEINEIPTMRYGSEPKKEGVLLKSKKIKKESHEEEEPTYHHTCNICLEDYKNREVLRILKCKHRFHKRCVDAWLLKKSKCPLCKRDA